LLCRSDDLSKTSESVYHEQQKSLTVLGKQHQIPFPVTWLSALVDVGRALIDGNKSLSVQHSSSESGS